MSSDKAWFRVKGVKLNVKWMREHQNYNVVDDLRKISCPVLAITGSKDMQVVPEQAKIITESVRGSGEWHVVEGVNHILRNQDRDTDMLSLIKEYKRELKNGDPVDARVLSIVENWLDRHFQESGEAE